MGREVLFVTEAKAIGPAPAWPVRSAQRKSERNESKENGDEPHKDYGIGLSRLAEGAGWDKEFPTEANAVGLVDSWMGGCTALKREGSSLLSLGSVD